jgi:hypothetical protein
MITMYKVNYGAFFQAYVLQRTLEGLGYAPELIRYDYLRDGMIGEVPLDHLRTPVRFFKEAAVSILKGREHRRRNAVIEECVQRRLRESPQYYKTYRKLEKQPPRYDIYLTGSDQVFNPRLEPRAYKSRLLAFAPGRMASYAASAGALDFPKAYLDLLNRQVR